MSRAYFITAFGFAGILRGTTATRRARPAWITLALSANASTLLQSRAVHTINTFTREVITLTVLSCNLLLGVFTLITLTHSALAQAPLVAYTRGVGRTTSVRVHRVDVLGGTFTLFTLEGHSTVTNATL